MADTSKNQLKRYRIHDNRGWQHAETECSDGPWVRYKDVEDDADKVHSDLALANVEIERLTKERDDLSREVATDRRQMNAPLPSEQELAL
jgi:hypothetical protein